MTASIVTDLEQAVHDRQRAARHTMVTALRTCQPIPIREDHVIAESVLHPDALSAPELAIAAEWERRSDEAIAQIRAEHQRVRGAIRRAGR